MGSIQNEVKSQWSALRRGQAKEIPSLVDTEFPAWTAILPDGRFSVVIPYAGEELVMESFASVWIQSLAIKNIACHKCLALSAYDPSHAFASLCAEFVNPGTTGSSRLSISSNPVAWWNEWKTLLGNRNVDQRAYDVLGELISLLALTKQGNDPVWGGPDKATCDIDCGSDKYEVKSTLTRDSKIVQVHGLYQLDDSETRKHLLLARFEPSIKGVSINSLVEELFNEGFSKADLNNCLLDLGYPDGSSARSRCYTLLDLTHYLVTDAFPHISASSFVDKELPRGVTSISYCISLDGVEGTSWRHYLTMNSLGGAQQ